MKKSFNLQVCYGFNFFTSNHDLPWKEFFIRSIALEFSTTSNKTPKQLLSAHLEVSDVLTYQEINSEQGAIGQTLRT